MLAPSFSHETVRRRHKSSSDFGFLELSDEVYCKAIISVTTTSAQDCKSSCSNKQQVAQLSLSIGEVLGKQKFQNRIAKLFASAGNAAAASSNGKPNKKAMFFNISKLRDYSGPEVYQELQRKQSLIKQCDERMVQYNERINNCKKQLTYATQQRSPSAAGLSEQIKQFESILSFYVSTRQKLMEEARYLGVELLSRYYPSLK